MAQSRYRAEKTSMRSGDGSAAQPRETSLLLRDGRSTYGGGFGSTNVQEAAPSQQSAFPGSTPSTTAFHPEDAASLFSRLTFGFYKQLVVHPATPPAVSSDAKAGGSNDDDASQGVCRNDAPSIRNIQNVWPLPPQSTTAHVAKAFEDVYLVERSVWRTVRRLEKAAIVTSFVLNVVVVCCDVASPFLLYRLLVKVLTLSSKASDMEILLLLFAIYVVKQIGSHCESLARFALFKASLRLDGALQTLSLRYMLEKPCDDMGESTSSGDQELLKRVSHFSEFRNISIFLMDKGKLWMDGCGIAAYLYVLNTALENKLQVIILPVSALIAVTALLNAVETEWVSTWAEKRNRANQLLRYVFHQILQIKMNAWEEKNLAKITSARVQESQVRWRLVALSIVKLALSWTSTDAILAAIFTATSVHDERLSPLLVYSTLLLFGSMRLKITHSFPGRLESRFRVKFAVRKIENLFASKFDSKEQQTQMERDADITRELQEDSSHAQVWMRNVTLGAGSGSDTKALIHCIDLEIYSGELVIVQGKAGTGKSTLLRSFIGDASLRNGRYRLPGARSTIAFCAQDPWLQTLSVKDNILFGLPYDQDKYACVLEACGLIDDLSKLPQNDDTRVGTKGMNLSGGQKARIALARACYNDADIYLLDSTLDCVDPIVQCEVFEKCLLTLLRYKTVVLVTHNPELISSSFADRKLTLENKSVITTKAQCHDTVGMTSQRVRAFEQASVPPWRSKSTRELNSALSDTMKNRRLNIWKTETLCFRSVQHEPAWDSNNPKAESVVATTTLAGSLEGNMKYGLLGWLSLGIFTGFSAFKDIWMICWASSDGGDGERSMLQYGMWYIQLVGAQLVCLVLTNMLFATIGFKVSVKLFLTMTTSLLYAPMSFFQKIPIGEVFQRYFNDLEAIGIEFITVTYCLTRPIYSIMCAIGILCYFLGIFGAVGVVLIYKIWRSMIAVQFFVEGSVSLRQAESANLDVLSDILAGSKVARAFGSAALQRLHLRYCSVLDDSAKLKYARHVHNCHVIFKYEMLQGVIFVFLGFVLTQHRDDMQSVSILGVAILYLLSLQASLMSLGTGVVLGSAYLLRVQQVLHFSHGYSLHDQESERAKGERSLQYSGNEATSSWPTGGSIVFKKVWFRYSDDQASQFVLKDVSFAVESGQTIGLIGRTGSGKSSLAMALLRIHTLARGEIIVDGVDISSLSLSVLRRRLCVIPQSPMFYRCSVREYLDPFEEFEDHCLWNVLRKSGLVATSGGPIRDLSDELAENGENRSTGERQLLCISRALLNPSPIVILDEAFSSLDQTQDDYIIEVVTREFQRSTVFLITHRLDQVLSFDKIMVMKDGYMIGCGEVEELIADPDSAFYEFLETTLLTQ